jgi:hypothetical protein
MTTPTLETLIFMAAPVKGTALGFTLAVGIVGGVYATVGATGAGVATVAANVVVLGLCVPSVGGGTA